MHGWLLDTNVLSELRKTRPDPDVKRWSDAQRPESFFLSTVALAEMRFGIESQPDEDFRKQLEDWLDHSVRPWFAERILPVDEDVILEWHRMVARGRKAGITYSQPDLFIAATAQVHGLTVCTRNERGFRGTRVPVVNPWST